MESSLDRGRPHSTPVLLKFLLLFTLAPGAFGAQEFLCYYRTHEKGQPVKTYENRCRAWCDGILNTGFAHVGKAPPGSTCQSLPVGENQNGWDDWKPRIKLCQTKRLCNFEGHGEDFPEGMGTNVQGVALQCLKKNCSFSTNSCIALPPHQQDDFFAAIEALLNGTTVPSQGRLIFFGSQAWVNCDIQVLNHLGVYALPAQDGQCKLAVLYPRCTYPFTPYPNQAPPNGDPNPHCWLPEQEVICQDTNSPVTQPSQAGQQTLAREMCCSIHDPGADTFIDRMVKCGPGKDAPCACPRPPCNKWLSEMGAPQSKSCIAGFANRPKLRPGRLPKCEAEGDQGEGVAMCCRKLQPDANGIYQEADYAKPGVWAPVGPTVCPDLIGYGELPPP